MDRFKPQISLSNQGWALSGQGWALSGLELTLSGLGWALQAWAASFQAWRGLSMTDTLSFCFSYLTIFLIVGQIHLVSIFGGIP